MNREKKYELQVAALKNGTAIDHIPPEQLFRVASLLELDKLKDETVTIGNNLPSKKMKKKGVIKIADKFFREDEICRIALIAPHAVMNEIRDYEVVRKYCVSLPDELVGLVRCNNPKCISNNEPMDTRFEVLDKERCLLRCRYCERKIHKEEIRMK